MTLKVNTREDWACPPTTIENLNPAGVLGVAWHYPGGYAYRYDSHDTCLQSVRSWDQMHRNRGWRMLGYNGLICHHGYFIEGRSRWNHLLNRSAANGSVTANLQNLGFQFIWGPKDGPVPEYMYRMAGEVTARARAQGAGRRVTGHRDHYATECPGNDIYSNLWKIRQYADNPAPGEEEDMTPEQDAILRSLSSTLTVVHDTLTPGKEGVKFEGEVYGAVMRVPALQAEIAGLKAAVDALAGTQGADPKVIAEIVTKAVEDAMSGVRVVVERPEPQPPVEPEPPAPKG